MCKYNQGLGSSNTVNPLDIKLTGGEVYRGALFGWNKTLGISKIMYIKVHHIEGSLVSLIASCSSSSGAISLVAKSMIFSCT